jgi:eukaryotic-like serine/threonine-protein kinase
VTTPAKLFCDDDRAVSGDDIQLPQATKTWLDEAKTQELPPRGTLAPRRAAEGRAARAVAILDHLTPATALELGESIGEGGMSYVRRGRQIALGREVAVKTLHAGEPDPRAMFRLLREAWMTGMLEHPNIVPVHDIVKGVSGTPQIVLKRIDGSPWSKVMHDEEALRDRFAVRDALDWNIRTLMQVCNAIHFAHSRGVLHRDLKSDNVMIGAFGEVYVLDWGLGVALADDGTGRLPVLAEVDSIAGTPAYMAPEMLEGRGDVLSVRTDVYLLGSLLYEIVTGWPPHLAATTREIFYKIARSSPALPPSTPAELEGIVRRALARDPGARFGSAEELRLALAAFLEHRASIALATEAQTKLMELELACVEAGDRTRMPEERGQQRYHLFGECRFAFREALRAWPDNTAAREGLRRAVVVMAQVELGRGDPRAAEMLVLELDDPPPELAERVRNARRARDEKEKRLASMARDHDPRSGRRARMYVSAGLGVLWTALPWVGWFLERGDAQADQRAPLFSSTLMFVLASMVAYRLRAALSRSALNRSLFRSIGTVLAAQIALFAVTYKLGVSYEHTRVLVLLLYAACCSITAAAVEPRLWPSAATYLAILGIATVWPAAAWPVESIANLVLTVNVLIIWRAEPDELSVT